MPDPRRETDLFFPTASTEFSISNVLRSLKRDDSSIVNRLRSIDHDARFVMRVADSYGLPLIANERCGSWYIPPDKKAGSVYFKSTDGHNGQWKFSLRRLNLHVLDAINSNETRQQGCIIVDSTRRGKSMPDALSKTIPIWIAVLNRLLFPSMTDAHALRTPEDVVSRSEHDQIEACLPSFLIELKSLDLNLDELRGKLRARPLVPVWITGDSELSETSLEQKCMTIVLCTASGRTKSLEGACSGYVQGAADDSESWAAGLDAAIFWKHHPKLLSMNQAQIAELVAHERAYRTGLGTNREPNLIRPTTTIYTTTNAAMQRHATHFDVLVYCLDESSPYETPALAKKSIIFRCAPGKLGSRQLRAQLHQIEKLASWVDNASQKILISCETGKDFSIGIALAVISKFVSDNGVLDITNSRSSLNKAKIKQRLSWIMLSLPDASPSRATLQSVNAYLLG